MNVATNGPLRLPLALMMALLTCCAAATAEQPFIYGIGPINLDLERWTFSARQSQGSHFDIVTEKKSGKRIIFVYLDTGVRTAEESLAIIQRLIRGPNDLQITVAPKVEEGAVAGGVLANYEAMRIERVAIVVSARPRKALVFISTGDNPMEDPDLLSIKKLADNTHL